MIHSSIHSSLALGRMGIKGDVLKFRLPKLISKSHQSDTLVSSDITEIPFLEREDPIKTRDIWREGRGGKENASKK